MQSNTITEQGNHIIKEKINSLDEFWDYISHSEIIYARYRMYPSAFFFCWQIKIIKKWIDSEYFFKVEKITNNNNKQ